MNNDGNKIRTFKDLYAWQEGHKLVLIVYQITEKFPEKEKYSIVDQMRRAVVSITSNIAEGFSRRSAKEKNRFYCVAQASLVELQNQFIISKDIGYLPEEEFKKAEEQLTTTGKLLTGLLRATKDKKFQH